MTGTNIEPRKRAAFEKLAAEVGAGIYRRISVTPSAGCPLTAFLPSRRDERSPRGGLGRPGPAVRHVGWWSKSYVWYPTEWRECAKKR